MPPTPVHKRSERRAVYALGSFDGLHPGHLRLAGVARDIAAAEKLTAGVAGFDPHPREILRPDTPPFRLTLAPAQRRILSAQGIGLFTALPFSREMAEMGAEEFIRDVLVARLRAAHVVVGPDFVFGRNRSGSVADLHRAAAAGIVGVTVADELRDEKGLRYSSTRIREALSQADFTTAASLMGRPFVFEDDVVHGDQRGRMLGFPTANMHVARYQRIPFGVYAVRARIGGEGAWLFGAANFGIRPMFGTQSGQPLLETYIFDLNEDIYGENLHIMPIKRLRGEQKFDSLDALCAQMKQDCADAHAVLESSPL